MDNMKIGIIGMGIVGVAIDHSYLFTDCEVVRRDLAKGYTASFAEFVDCDGIFVCVPTPIGEAGQCNTSILADVLEDLYQVNYKGVIISKCTAPPDAYEYLINQYPNLVHSPEFLTEANARNDYMTGNLLVLGGSDYFNNLAESVIKQAITPQQVFKVDIKTASLYKYFLNSYLALKVVAMNEFYQLSNANNVDWETIKGMLKQDSRVGSTHLNVPGADGSFGFGGMCFPKDTRALLSLAKSQNVDLSVLEAAVYKNISLRNLL
jgi:UDPglucose 6-dehydrogenase